MLAILVSSRVLTSQVLAKIARKVTIALEVTLEQLRALQATSALKAPPATTMMIKPQQLATTTKQVPKPSKCVHLAPSPRLQGSPSARIVSKVSGAIILHFRTLTMMLCVHQGSTVPRMTQ